MKQNNNKKNKEKKKKISIIATSISWEECHLAFTLDCAALKKKRSSYDAVTWSGASADESLHYYGLSLFIYTVF